MNCSEMKDKKKFVISFSFETLLDYHADQDILDQACSYHEYDPDELDYHEKEELLGEQAYDDAFNSLYESDIHDLIQEDLYALYPDDNPYIQEPECSISLTTICENFQETSRDSWSLSTPCKISGKMTVFLKNFNQDEFEDELKKSIQYYLNDSLPESFTCILDTSLNVETMEVANVESEIIKKLETIDYKKEFSALISEKLSNLPYFEVAKDAFDSFLSHPKFKASSVEEGVILDKPFIEKCLDKMTDFENSDKLQDDLDLFLLHPDQNSRHYKILNSDFIGIINTEFSNQQGRLAENFDNYVKQEKERIEKNELQSEKKGRRR